MARVVTIFGATGNQGGSVARSLLRNTSFKIRAITRNPSSSAGRALASAGADVLKADGFKHSELLDAFKGSWGAFVNINSNDPAVSRDEGPTELDLGKRIVDAAAEAKVQHLVFSTLPPCSEMTGGKVKMKSFDMKHRIEQYARHLDKFETFSAVTAGWYLETFLDKEMAPAMGGFPFIPDDEGYLTLKTPYWGDRDEQQAPFIAIGEDFGDIVHGIFLDPARWNGQNVQGVSDIRSLSQLVADFEDATGNKARFDPILPDWQAFKTDGDPFLEEFISVFGFVQTTGGRYFLTGSNENETAAELKRLASEAAGRSGDQQHLMTAKQWFRKSCAS